MSKPTSPERSASPSIISTFLASSSDDSSTEENRRTNTTEDTAALLQARGNHTHSQSHFLYTHSLRKTHPDTNFKIYHFRQSTRQNTTNRTETCIDQDATSDYDSNDPRDPYAHNLTETLRRPKRPRLEDTSDPSVQNRSQRPYCPSWRQGRYSGLQLNVILKDRTIAWRDFLKSLDVRCGQSEDTNHLHSQPTDTIQQNESGPRSNEHKRLKGWTTQDKSRASIQETQFPTLGHPAARGCISCYELGEHCPLIDESKWPCYTCQDEHIECELITEPKHKARCIGCKKRGQKCSFDYKESVAGPCDECQHASRQCITGPRGGYTREGPSLNRPPKDLTRLTRR